MKRTILLLLVIFFAFAVSIFAQQGKFVKTDGTTVTFHHLNGILLKDSVYPSNKELTKYFPVVYKNKQYELTFDKVRMVSFFQNDSDLMFKITSRSGLNVSLPLNFTAVDILTIDSLSMEVAIVRLLIVDEKSRPKSFLVKEIQFE